MANSWIEAAGILGLDLALACPPGHAPNEDIVRRARGTERGRITFCADASEAARGRHVLSTDVFASMGQEDQAERRRQEFGGYSLDARLVATADARRDRAALPARSPRRGDQRRGDRGAAQSRVAAGGEPAPRPEGPPGSVSVEARSPASLRRWASGMTCRVGEPAVGACPFSGKGSEVSLKVGQRSAETKSR